MTSMGSFGGLLTPLKTDMKLDGLIRWRSLKWTVKGDSWLCDMINEPNWTIKSGQFDFLNESSSKNRKLMIT